MSDRPEQRERLCPCIAREKVMCGSPTCWHFGYNGGDCYACGNTGAVPPRDPNDLRRLPVR